MSDAILGEELDAVDTERVQQEIYLISQQPKYPPELCANGQFDENMFKSYWRRMITKTSPSRVQRDAILSLRTL